MKNARHVIAFTLVATALCADRSLPAAPLEPASTHLCGRIIQRLTINFRRVVPAFQPYRPQRFGLAPAMRCHCAPALTVDRLGPSLSPFEFRLPPPLA